MYLTIKQHDAFRTLVMGFEIPFRKYISDIVISTCPTEESFDSLMRSKNSQLTPTSPDFLKKVLSNACSKNTLKNVYAKFKTATTSVEEIVATDIDIPMVGALNLVTFSLTEHFGDLYALFGSYSSFCDLSEKYRYVRNKLDHPGSRTLEDEHLIPVLSFIKDICLFLDDACFLQKTRDHLLSEVSALQQRNIPMPVKVHNFPEMPYSESRIVCRDAEIQILKDFIYGKPEDLRKRHSCCIYGYGGVGKTALVLEVLKQVVGDLQDGTTINEYNPEYLLFFSAKRRRLDLASETGRFIEQPMRSHFETAAELIELILSALQLDSFRKFHEEGVIVVDNLETLTGEERQKVKAFVETQTPAEMQFILTSRNSEEYETNYKLGGFDAEPGRKFIKTYCEENSLELSLSPIDEDELLTLAKGNTLVLVLSMRRLSRNLSTLSSLKAEFNSGNAWKSLKSTLSKTPSNAYEVIAEFMFKDTFEHIETTFADNVELFYKILKVFAILQNDSTDISTLCLLTGESFPDVETVVDVLCSFLILEKKDTFYAMSGFAEKYIVSRFLPDADTYERVSKEILTRRNSVKESLEKLQEDIQNNPALAKIITDWSIITDVDQTTAAEMNKLYREVNRSCNSAGRFKVESVFETFIRKCDEYEGLTAHPFVKYQKARILQIVDRSNILPEKHVDEIRKSFNDAIYSIKTIEQYAGIQQTKSYASLLWIYGLYLSDCHDIPTAMRYLEESKSSFEAQQITDQEYYQCSSLLGTLYLDYYEEDRSSRLVYLRKARTISRMLSDNWHDLGKARNHANQLKIRLGSFGQY